MSDTAFYNFFNQWLAGLQPQLSLETGRYGQIRISSQVVPLLNLSSIALLMKLDLATALAIMASHDRDVAFAAKLHEKLQLRKLFKKAVEKENDALPSAEIDAAQSPLIPRPIIAR